MAIEKQLKMSFAHCFEMRTQTIISFFRLLGVAERQDFGGAQIFNTAFKNDYRLPEIEINLERTSLKVWNIDLSNAYPNLSNEEKLGFNFIVKSTTSVSRKEIESPCDITPCQVRKSIESLLEKQLIDIIGQSRSTQYSPKFRSNEMIVHIQAALQSLQNNI